MTETAAPRLAPPLDRVNDHVLGPADAPIALVEYGSYACSYCRAAHDRIVELRDEFGDRLAHAFRHRPLSGSELAVRAAELAERASATGQFWKAHVALMTRSDTLREEDLDAIAVELDLPPPDSEAGRAAVQRVREDTDSAARSGVAFTPTFFINGRRYDGPWDGRSFAEAMRGALGYRVRAAALEFVNWTPSTGILLAAAALAAVLLSNSAAGPAFAAFWATEVGLAWEGGGFLLPLSSWVNDGLLTIFFLVVGLEIKREFTIGHLSEKRLAALPVAAAIGGMAMPSLIYLALVPAGDWMRGWAVPIATDTAFAVALIAMLGRRVPIELRIFLTAAAIVDDIAAIAILAAFYSHGLELAWLAGALGIVGLLYALNRTGVYRVLPYAMLGTALWFCIHEGGVHATLAGVLLALFIPTRPPANYRALTAQMDAVISAEVRRDSGEMRHSLTNAGIRAVDAIHDRMESPASRLLRHVEVRSSYLVLPIFALANAGVAITPTLLEGRGGLVVAIAAGLVVGKPTGMLLASWIAVKAGLAQKPEAYGWGHVLGAGALAGIGFTMSLFIAGQSYAAEDFGAAKLAIFGASILAAALGAALLWWIGRHAPAADG